jgi:hypothetical protein
MKRLVLTFSAMIVLALSAWGKPLRLSVRRRQEWRRRGEATTTGRNAGTIAAGIATSGATIGDIPYNARSYWGSVLRTDVPAVATPSLRRRSRACSASFDLG